MVKIRKLAIFPACDDGGFVGSGGREMVAAFGVGSGARGKESGDDFFGA